MPNPNPKLNVYFPINNLNPQGWISEFITAVINRSSIKRDPLANLFYDESLDSISETLSRKTILGTKGAKEYKSVRARNEDPKLIFINGKYLDIFEVDSSIRDSTASKEELRVYTEFLSRAKPYQLAFLQPYIKLSYGWRDNPKDEFQFYDFPFTQAYNSEASLLSSTNGGLENISRVDGTGIVSLDVENEYSIGVPIRSTVKIDFVFGSMKELTREREISGFYKNPPKDFSLMKILSYMDNSKEVIKLEYGRKVMPGFIEVAGIENPKNLIDILNRKEKKTIFLSKSRNSFSFDDKGVIRIGVEYYNFSSTTINEPNCVTIPADNNMNQAYLKLPEEKYKLLKNFRNLENKSKSLEEKISGVASGLAEKISKQDEDEINENINRLTKELKETNKTLNTIKRSIKSETTSYLLDKIKSQGQLFSVSFHSKKEKEVFSISTKISLVSPETGTIIPVYKIPFSYDGGKLLEDARIKSRISEDKSFESKLKRILSRVFNAPYDDTSSDESKTYGHLMFFPLKALIYAGFSNLSLKERETMPYMIFGNVLMRINDKTCSINIGDLLIETTTFQTWFYEKYFKTDMLDYNFGRFIQDILDDLVPEASFRNPVGFSDGSPFSLVSRVDGYIKGPVSIDLKRQLYLNKSDEELGMFTKYLERFPTSNGSNPILYYGQLTNPTSQISSPTFSNLGVEEFSYNEFKDAEKGIPHIKIGSDGGFYTELGFEAQDFSKVRSAYMLEALANKASRYFQFQYSLNLTTIGNNLFEASSVICVPSNPLGISSDTHDPGISGYYKVISTSDSISADLMYLTKARCNHVFDPNSRQLDKKRPKENPTSREWINDSVPLRETDPILYIGQLLDNDINAIINLEAEKASVPKKIVKEKAEKNRTPPKKRKMIKLDIEEQIG
jgi:hypothetical protein